jgi:hypothetical protein
MTLEEQIAVMRAYADGKTVEARNRHTNSSWYACPFPGWNWESFDYRVKTEPKVIYVNEYRTDSPTERHYGSLSMTPTEAFARSLGSAKFIRTIKFVEAQE